MPRFDKTGPNGEGSKTGRGMGDCNSEDLKNDSKVTEKRPFLGRKRPLNGQGRKNRGRNF